MRGGTENLYGIVGLGKALELAVTNMEARRAHVAELKSYMKSRLDKELDDVAYNGYTDERSHYKVLNVSLPHNTKTDLILFNLDIAGICASGGSACTSGSEVGSHVLAGINAAQDRKSVRFSFSIHNTREEIDYVVEELKKMVNIKEPAGVK